MHGSVFISVHQWFDSSDSFSANLILSNTLFFLLLVQVQEQLQGKRDIKDVNVCIFCIIFCVHDGSLTTAAKSTCFVSLADFNPSPHPKPTILPILLSSQNE